MKFGAPLPTWLGGFAPASSAGPQSIIQIIQMAERLGYDSIWSVDRIDPGSSGRQDGPPPNRYEILIIFAYAAAVTERIRLGTGVIILPLREPVILAKQVATLDGCSNGRLLLGVGLGVSRDEFASIRGKDRMANRGKMHDEALEILNLLFTQDDVSFQGDYFELHGVSLNPKPVQQPLPIYISGNAPDTLARVSRFGTGWIHSVDYAPEVFRERVDKLRPVMEAAGRDFSELDVAVVSVQSVARTHEEAVERFLSSRRVTSRLRRKDLDTFVVENFIGTPDEVVEKIKRLEKDGATHVISLHVAADTLQELEEQIQMFGEEVLPAFK